jgi:hypothetical protein
VLGFLKTRVPYSYDETNKVLSHMSGVPVRELWPLTRTAYSEMCPIKGPKRLNKALSRRWKKPATAFRVSVSKLYVTFCGAAVKQKAMVIVEVPRSHTVRRKHTL